MKTISGHLGQIILSVCAIALIVGILLCFTTPIGQFFGNILNKTNEQAMGEIWDYGAYEPNGFGGGSSALVAGLYDRGGTLLADWTTLGADISKNYDDSSCKTDSNSLYFKLSSNSAYDAGTTLVIPEGTTTIGEWAFGHNKNITTVVIPDSITSIGYSAFYGCTNLSSVTFGENSQLTRIEQNAFSSCTSLTSIEIPDSVTYIGDSAFSDTGLTSITIPEGLTYFGDSAFSGCEDLVSAFLPEDIRGISYGVFNNCTSLMSITIPDSVRTVGDYAFNNCTNLTTVTFGENSTLDYVGARAFYGCTSLESIMLPAGITEISYEAFASCLNLNSIEFEGSMEQWNAITFGTDWNYRVAATYVQCNDDRVDFPSDY